ncbi:MAG: hypothetical protein ACREJM_07790 [Candidatus Saccharimonadales bacterium]
MSHNHEAPAFEVSFGRQTAEEDADMKVLATYVMHGLVQGETSRFERIFQSLDVLDLPEGVNDFRIGRRLETGESYTPTFRMFVGRGIVADLIEPAVDEDHDRASEAVATATGSAGAALSAEAAAPVTLFPVKSLFRTSEA